MRYITEISELMTRVGMDSPIYSLHTYTRQKVRIINILSIINDINMIAKKADISSIIAAK